MKKLNQTFRKKNRPTDVLSFAEWEAPAPISARSRVGEIFVCWAVAQKQARDAGILARNELDMLVVHGVLHLFGYDHEGGGAEAKKMFSLQAKILSRL